MSWNQETDDVILGVHEGGRHIAESIIISRYQMFNQVYFHKTRRAFDLMLQEALKGIYNPFPSPEDNEIDRYLELDDYSAWYRIKNNQKDFWCNSIFSRNPLRLLDKTKEILTKEDEERLNKTKEKLESEGIWYNEDCAKEVWYRFNEDKVGKDEIMIVGNGKKAIPLSKYSKIVENIGSSRQLRIYVKLEDREKSLRIIRGN